MKSILFACMILFSCSLMAQVEKTALENEYATAKPVISDGSNVITAPIITIYTKNGHSKSTELLIALAEYGIQHNDVNVSYSQETKQAYKDLLSDNDLTKKEAKLPIVIFQDVIYYDIRNMKKFCKSTLVGDQKKVKKSQRKY